MLKTLLTHPLTAGLDLDDPQTTILRKHIIQEKSFLRKIYLEWYAEIMEALPDDLGRILELGSGAGFLQEFIPELITSELFHHSDLNTVLDGLQLPFANRALDGITMINVLHHLPQPRRFFQEAGRCIKANGKIIMIEPWVTQWSSLIYKKLHHEPFHPGAIDWDFPVNGPLSGANGALPWILFQRDRSQFEQEFPQWQIQTIKPLMPFRYLVSGGVSMRNLMPGWSFLLWRTLENGLGLWQDNLAMFAKVVLHRTQSD